MLTPRTLAIGATGVFVLAAPAVALACPVCGLAGTSDNTWAYGAMSVMLSAVPLGMIVGVSTWLVRRNNKRDEAETTAR
jgi:hypothetical protein